MTHRYFCDSCSSLVTTPEPYDGKHWVGLPGIGFVRLPCPGKLKPISESEEKAILEAPSVRALKKLRKAAIP